MNSSDKKHLKIYDLLLLFINCLLGILIQHGRFVCIFFMICALFYLFVRIKYYHFITTLLSFEYLCFLSI